jgi:predicted nucleotide-binding protein
MRIVGELIQLADTIAHDRAQMEEIRLPAKALERAATEADRAWSGSNIGYHARVYFAGLRPPPPEAIFSAEWGLMDRWPTHQPHPGWQIMDEEAVRREISVRAGGVDPREIDTKLTTVRRAFDAHRDNLLSLLSTLPSRSKDPFLEKKLQQIEELKAPPPGIMADALRPHGQVWSRDSTALSEGVGLAPHQFLLAVSYSVGVTEESLRVLEQVARLAAAHLQRLNPKGNIGVQTGGAITFIGHGRSLVWRELKDFLKETLGLGVSEFNSVSAAGVATVDRLQEMLDAAEFAFIIMTGEDEQADGQLHARQNVIHEAGLFQGRLGFGKAIILVEDGCADFSNIHGLGVIQFSKGKISSCFEDVRRVLAREKVVTVPM